MKITDVTNITDRGVAVFTDESWTVEKQQSFTKYKKLKVTTGNELIEMNILSVEAVLKADRTESVAFMVSPIINPGIIEFIKGTDIELE